MTSPDFLAKRTRRPSLSSFQPILVGSFDFGSKPRLEIPALPDPATVVSQACPGNPDYTAVRVSSD